MIDVTDTRERIGGLDAWRGVLVSIVALAHFFTSTGVGAGRDDAYEVTAPLTTLQAEGTSAGLLTSPQLARPFVLGWAVVPTSQDGPGITSVRVKVGSGEWRNAAMGQPTPGMGLTNAEFTSAGWTTVLPEPPSPGTPVPVYVELSTKQGRTATYEGELRWNGAQPWFARIRWAPVIGHAAVDHFFVISGFLITLILVRTPRVPGYLRTFWVRRALRILPLAWLLVACAWVILPGYREHLPAFALFLANFVRQSVPGLDPMWSLAVEEQFYLVYPVLFWFVPRHRIWWLVGGLCLVFAAIRLHLPAFYVSGLYIGQGDTHLRAIALALGGWLAIVHAGLVPRPRLCAAVFIGWCVAWALWGGSAPLFETNGRLGVLDPIALGGALVLLWWMSRRPISGPAWLVFLGRRCYGLYLLHVPAIIVVQVLVPWLPLPIRFVLWALLTIGSAAASYRYLERPLLALAPKAPQASA